MSIKQKYDEELLQMSEIQVSIGRSSSATHRVTQSSTTLNRRYVRRPSNLAIEETASNSARDEKKAPMAPSRLVNLRVSAVALEEARIKEEEARRMKNQIKEEAQSVTFTPTIVELGQDTSNASSGATNIAVPEIKELNTIPQPDIKAGITSDRTEINTLAMNIAADYATASLKASVSERSTAEEQNSPVVQNTPVDSVDAIARAASEAIASIRVATEPSEVSEQVSSLKAFADNIKSEQSMPEMRELGDTIDKFINIAMKSTKMQEASKKQAVSKAVTLSPKAHRAATKVTKTSAKVMQANNRAKQAATNTRRMPMRGSNMHRTMPKAQMITKSTNEHILKDAMHSVATMGSTSAPKPMPKIRRRGSTKRFAIAIACATACVLGVISLVTSNMPDISIRVAALQTGIEASYPAYIPRDFSLDNISSESGKITMSFTGPDNASFTLIEEKSSWDSSALLRNYVEPTWGEDYTTTHEQGITIYISDTASDATWVNGGVLYKIASSDNALTKKQMRSIVVSL